jgi:hypothetical protein
MPYKCFLSLVFQFSVRQRNIKLGFHYKCNYYVFVYDTVSTVKVWIVNGWGVTQKVAGVAYFKILTWHLFKVTGEKA